MFLVSALLASLFCAHAAADQNALPDSGMTLVRAVMCEYIEEYEPQNSAVVFSINVGKISCFTSFDGIKTTTNWLPQNA